MSKILIIKLGALGDMVLASAAFSAIRKRFPESELFLLTTRSYFPLLKGCPYFKRYFFFEREKPFLPQIRKMSALFRKEKFQLAVNLQNNFKSNLFAWLSRAPKRVGFRKGHVPGLLTGSVAYNHQENALRNLEQVLALADVQTIDNPEIYLTSQANEEAGRLLNNLGWKNEPLVGLHPGSSAGWQSKRWPARCWINLAREIAKKGFIPLFIGDWSEAAELEKMAAEVQKTQKGKVFNLAGKTTLSMLPALIKKFQAFVSTDSGPLFLAAAGGVKTIGLYGPTESRRHAPPGVVVLERKDLPCRPCYRKSCAQPLCMDNITPEEILSLLW